MFSEKFWILQVSAHPKLLPFLPVEIICWLPWKTMAILGWSSSHQGRRNKVDKHRHNEPTCGDLVARWWGLAAGSCRASIQSISSFLVWFRFLLFPVARSEGDRPLCVIVSIRSDVANGDKHWTLANLSISTATGDKSQEFAYLSLCATRVYARGRGACAARGGRLTRHRLGAVAMWGGGLAERVVDGPRFSGFDPVKLAKYSLVAARCTPLPDCSVERSPDRAPFPHRRCSHHHLHQPRHCSI